MTFSKTVKKLSVIASVTLSLNALSINPAMAHARWVVPSHTVVSGDKPMAISFDYSISNAIFHPDIPMGGTELVKTDSPIGAGNPMMNIMEKTQASVTQPSGKTINVPSVNLGRKTSSYFTAEASGTYRIDITQPPIEVTLFKTKDGEAQRLFGKLSDVKEKLPTGAKDIESLQFNNRIQTFVTHNQISTETLKPTGDGLEVTHKTHPNELFASESSSYQLFLNGKVVKDIQASHIKITKDGTRFRNQRASLEPSLNKAGEFTVTWPEAGFYLVEIDHEVSTKNGKVVYALFLTVEIQPE